MTKQEIFEYAFEQEKSEFEDEMAYDVKKDNRNREYQRKWLKLWKRLPTKAYINKLLENNGQLSENEGKIVVALLRAITKQHSIASKWVNRGIADWSSEQIVELYEEVKDQIEDEFLDRDLSQNVMLQEWLQMLDIELGYTTAKKACDVKNTVEAIRREGLPIDHQINLGEILSESEGGELQYIQKKDGRDVEMDDVLHNLGQYFSEFNQHIRNYLSVVSKESQDVVESTVFISELANLFFKNDIKPCTGLGTFFDKSHETMELYMEYEKAYIQQACGWESVLIGFKDELQKVVGEGHKLDSELNICSGKIHRCLEEAVIRTEEYLSLLTERSDDIVQMQKDKMEELYRVAIMLDSTKYKTDFEEYMEQYSLNTVFDVINQIADECLNNIIRERDRQICSFIEIMRLRKLEIWQRTSEEQKKDSAYYPPVYAASYELRDRKVITYLQEHPKELQIYSRKYGCKGDELLEKINLLREYY